MKTDRLDKILCGTGMYTRSAARDLISGGLVAVDGIPVRRPETRVSRASELRVRGELLDTAEYVYCMMNKPAGYVSASKDEGGLPAVTGLLPEYLRRRGLQCAGRLDVDVTGLLLLTDDGDYIHRVISPRSEISKVYEVLADGPLTSEDAERLARGVTLENGTTYRPARLEPEDGDPRRVLVTVTEGKYHEVKNLIAYCGRRVLAMRRLAVGGLALDPALTPGAYRRLTEREIGLVLDKTV